MSGISEQMIQNSIYSKNLTILDKYECLNLGATTIRSLIETRTIKNYKVEKKVADKKPDVLIIDKDKEIVVYIEQKTPSKLKNEKDIKNAVEQEIFVAQALNVSIYIVCDGE